MRVVSFLKPCLFLASAFLLSTSSPTAKEFITTKDEPTTPAERTAAQQIADNQWIRLCEEFNDKHNLVIDAIKAKNPSWVVMNAKQLAELFNSNPLEAFSLYGNKPILIFAKIHSVDKAKHSKPIAINLNAGKGQHPIKAFPKGKQGREYAMGRRPGWMEILLCHLHVNKERLELTECIPHGLTLRSAIDDADDAILSALLGKGKNFAEVQAAVAASEVAKAYPQGTLSFNDGMQYGKAVEELTKTLTFEADPERFMEVAKRLGYSDQYLQSICPAIETSESKEPTVSGQ